MTRYSLETRRRTRRYSVSERIGWLAAALAAVAALSGAIVLFSQSGTPPARTAETSASSPRAP